MFISNIASDNNGSDIRDYYGTASMWTLTGIYESCSTSAAVKISVGFLSEQVDNNLRVVFVFFFKPI
jgi:hypothetical protein